MGQWRNSQRHGERRSRDLLCGEWRQDIAQELAARRRDSPAVPDRELRSHALPCWRSTWIGKHQSVFLRCYQRRFGDQPQSASAVSPRTLMPSTHGPPAECMESSYRAGRRKLAGSGLAHGYDSPWAIQFEAPHYYATAVTGANQHTSIPARCWRLRRTHRVVRRNNRRQSLRRLDHQRQQHVALSGIAVVIRSQPVCPGLGRWSTPYGYTLQGPSATVFS